MTRARPALTRRNLMTAVAGGGALAAAAALWVRGRGAPEAPPAPPASGPSPRGYRLTEHVQRYYRSARL